MWWLKGSTTQSAREINETFRKLTMPVVTIAAQPPTELNAQPLYKFDRRDEVRLPIARC
jgi:hypothetical protein